MSWCRMFKVYEGTRVGLTRVIGLWVVIELVTGARPDPRLRKYVCYIRTFIDELVW